LEQAGEQVTVIGWGNTEGTGPSNILREVEVNVISNAQCSSDYSQYGGVSDVMLCAEADNKDSCQVCVIYVRLFACV
jgi:hypothetical protein